jgi:hypothetical protein
MRHLLLPLLLILAGCAAPGRVSDRGGDYLFVWAAPEDAAESDFLAVVDIAPASPTYAQIVASVPVGGRRGFAHHTEHQMPAGGMLAANAFGSGRTYLFDLRRPLSPSVAASFGDAGEYMHPHSFARLPNGNLLATYQMRGHGNARPGGLAEIAPDGRIVRTSDAADPATAEPFIRPYSLTIVPTLDRVVTTSTDMHAAAISRAVQVWRLSDLSLIRTIVLPRGPRGTENEDPAEPRLLADGRTVMVSTFNCGLYLLRGLEGRDPSAQLVHSFSASDKCALPVVAGRYWVQTDAGVPALISLDISDPARPREVGRLTLGPRQFLHWIALAPDGERIVLSGGNGDMSHRVLIARIDRLSGRLSLDETFRTPGAAEPGISFDREDWPHGRFGKAEPHGAVFSN